MDVHEIDRPHESTPTDSIRTALSGLSRDARRYARTGPKKYEDVCHLLADELLTELQRRGAI